MQWTLEELEQLQSLYPTTSSKILAQQLGRTVASVNNKAYEYGIKKIINLIINKNTSRFQNFFDYITREEVMKLDKVGLLRVSWRLLQMQERELANPNLSDNQRHKLMNGISNLINTINCINKTTQEKPAVTDSGP